VVHSQPLDGRGTSFFHRKVRQVLRSPNTSLALAPAVQMVHGIFSFCSGSQHRGKSLKAADIC
jgi:hypothetical protein